MSASRNFTTIDSSNFESFHQSTESDFSLMLSRFGKSFVGSQDAFMSGKPPILGDLLSPYFTSDGLLITSTHEFLGRMMQLHTNGFTQPFGIVDKKVDAFFKVLRHCADRSEWNPILKLEDAISTFKKELDKYRSNPDPKAYYKYFVEAAKLGLTVDELMLALHDIVQHRERNINMGWAEPSVGRDDAPVHQLTQLYFVFNEAGSGYAEDNSKLNALENGLANANSELASVKRTVVSLAAGKKERKSLKLSDRALKRALAYWMNSRHAQGWAHMQYGRAISKRNVYDHFQKELNGLGICSVDDLKHAIDNARKQFPDYYAKLASRNNGCQPGLF